MEIHGYESEEESDGRDATRLLMAQWREVFAPEVLYSHLVVQLENCQNKFFKIKRKGSASSAKIRVRKWYRLTFIMPGFLLSVVAQSNLLSPSAASKE